MIYIFIVKIEYYPMLCFYRCMSHRNNMFYTSHSIPDCFWRMQSLKQLYISGNGLKGSLDTFKLQNISELSISSNRLSGRPSLPQNFLSFKVFDISNNRFIGYLDGNIKSTGDPGNMIKANVNRISGRLNTNSIKTFDDISVLNGNLISCSTLPSKDSGLNTYVCETNDLETAVIVWCVVCACFFLLLALRFNPWCNFHFLSWIDYLQNLIYFHTSLSDHVKQSIPLSVQFIDDLFKLLKVSSIISVALVFVTIIIYSGFKLGEGSEEVKSHTDQYLYLVSGVYLRSAGPACTLFVIYIVFFVSLVFVLNRLFVVDSLTRSQSYWKSIWSFTNDKIIHSDITPKKNVITKKFFQNLAFFIFLGFSLFANALYINSLNRLNGTKLTLVQIMFSLFNIGYQTIGIPLLFDYIFPMQYGHTPSSTLMYTIILILIKVINPCIAILFTNDLCFKNYFFTKQNVSVNYEISKCLFKLDSNCSKYRFEKVSYIVPLPFIFSDQCRNAIFRDYIPTILYSCVYSTFIEPIFFLWSTCKIKRFDEKFSIFGFIIRTHKLVLNDVTDSWAGCWADH